MPIVVTPAGIETVVRYVSVKALIPIILSEDGNLTVLSSVDSKAESAIPTVPAVMFASLIS